MSRRPIYRLNPPFLWSAGKLSHGISVVATLAIVASLFVGLVLMLSNEVLALRRLDLDLGYCDKPFGVMQARFGLERLPLPRRASWGCTT